MAESPVTIRLGNQTFIKTSDMSVKTLSKLSGAASVTLEAAAVDYQVPVGKIFKALEIKFTGPATSRVDFFSATAANAITGKVAMIEQYSLGSTEIMLNIDYVFAASLYVNVTGNDAANSCIVVGIEMDA